MNEEILFLVGRELREAAIALLTRSFVDDPYYAELMNRSAEGRLLYLSEIFSRSIDICFDYGMVVGRRDASSDRLIAVSLWFDYNVLREEAPEAFEYIFRAVTSKKAIRLAECIERIVGSDSEYLYLLSVAVDPSFRCQGIASEMVRAMIRCNPQYNLFSDVSNDRFAAALSKIGFRDMETCEGCRVMCRTTTMYEKLAALLSVKRINVVVPSHYSIAEVQNVEAMGHVCLDCLSAIPDTPYFQQHPFVSGGEGKVFSMDYSHFRRWQQLVNPLLCEELVIPTQWGDAVLYIRIESGIEGFLHYDENLRNQIAEHGYEWEKIADVYTLFPMSYDRENSFSMLHTKRSVAARRLLRALAFRTRYESGILVEGCKEYQSFASRICRRALGFVTIQLYCESEISFDGSRRSENEIGEPVQALLIISYDRLTRCAVLQMMMLCAGVFVTQYLDSVSRGQLSVLTDGGRMNLYDYMEVHYGLRKRGAAKNYITFNEQREHLDNRFLASVLYGETYYERGELLGNVIDAQIVDQLSNNHGAAQYDYASAYFHTNSVVHIVSSSIGVRDRIVSESVTLFYMEMVTYEEAAIEIMNHNVIHFLTHMDMMRPGALIRRINSLLNAHLKSIAFWNLKLNYPSSTRSLDIIRNAFCIPAKRAEVELNKRQLIALAQTRESYFTYIESRVLTVLGVLLTILSILDFILDVRKRMLIPIALITVAILLWFLWRRFSRLDRG